MFRNDNSISIVVMYFTGLLNLVLLSTILLLPVTLQAEDSSGVSRFTLQREKTLQADLTTPHAVNIPEIEVKERSGNYHIKIVAIINAPAPYVRHVLTDYSHLYTLNPAIKESEVLKQDDDGLVHVRTRIKGCASYFCEELDRVEKVQLLPSGDIAAETIPETGQFKSGQTQWKIKALGERSEVTYIADMKPDIFVPPVVSKFLVKKAIKKEAQTSFANLQKISSGLCSGRDGAEGKISVCD